MVGCHYLRPKETFHEPTRRFYPNEILRSPVTEYVPIELIHGRCWVVDPATYCKGRPIGMCFFNFTFGLMLLNILCSISKSCTLCVDCLEEHLYICEFRVDKTARIFNKIGRAQHTNIQPFAFRFFETRVKIQRNVHVSYADAFQIRLYLYHLNLQILFLCSHMVHQVQIFDKNPSLLRPP